jgi:hypothetical protein
VNYAFRVEGVRTVVYVTNPEGRGGCAWASIGGTVKTADRAPLNGYGLRIRGTVGETVYDEVVTSGSTPGLGPGGFELPIGRQAVDADFTIQLLDPAGTPVSPEIAFRTSSRCDWNMALIHFVPNAP